MDRYPVSKENGPNIQHPRPVAPTQRKSIDNRTRTISSFQGLRGLAVIFVMLYHLFPATVKGGFLGVPVFLALSGYLVTDSFLRSYNTKRSLFLGDFYKKRISRIFPPLIFVLLILTTWIFWVHPDLLLNYRENLFSTIGGYNNWWQITQNLSYFDLHGNLNPLTHMWTMGLEIQFYLAWPLLMSVIVRINKHNTRFVTFAASFLLAVASFTAMVVLTALKFPITRVYYGTDTRAFSFLLGAMLAGLLPVSRLRRLTDYLPRKDLDFIGLIVTFLVLIFMFFLPGDRAIAYYFGIFSFSVLIVILLACVGDRRTVFGRVFSLKPLRVIGKRSYSLYLWQYSIMILSQDLLRFVKISYWTTVVVQLIVVVLMAEFTYRLTEVNWSRFVNYLLRSIQSDRSPEPTTRNRKMIANISVWLVVVFCFSSTVAAVVRAPTGKAAYTDELAERIEGQASDESVYEEDEALTAQKSGVEVQVGSALDFDSVLRLLDPEMETEPVETTDPAEYLSEQARLVVRNYPELTMGEDEVDFLQSLPITCIGDSVAASAAAELKNAMPMIDVDSKVSRQFPDGIKLLLEKQVSDNLQTDILFMLGTNGVLNDSMVQEVCTEFSDHNIYFLTVVELSPEVEERINQTLKRASQPYDNAVVIDWYEFAKTKPELFYGDATHPNATGAKVFAEFVAKELARSRLAEVTD